MTKNKSKILLVEDEAHLLFYLTLNLEQEGFEVIPATDGEMALAKFEEASPYALVLMDVNMPKMNGFEVARKIRDQDPKIGILLLTARASDEDRLQGLKLGVDDYVVKPFQLEELMLRVKRMAARSEIISPKAASGGSSTFIRVGQFELSVGQLMLKTPSQSIELTELEARLLEQFFYNPNQVLTRTTLLEKVWGVGKQFETRTVDNFVGRLRKYLEEDPSKPKFLTTVRGRGYRLNLEEETS